MFKINADAADFRLDSYAFELPEELIAQRPSARRGADALYVLDRSRPNAEGDAVAPFPDLPSLLPPRSLLVANNSRVAPARILTARPSGGVLEVLLLSPPPLVEAEARAEDGEFHAPARALLRPARKIERGRRYELAPGLAMRVGEKLDFGQAEIELIWRGGLAERIAGAGQLPLPPYIKRPPSAADVERYQTVYADPGRAGSLAAPTAGLHFTPEIRQALLAAGHSWAELTLFVGYGTFSPVRVPDIRDHEMHAEYVELPADTVRLVLEAKAQGRPVVAVGTTSARVLEGVAAELAGPDRESPPGRALPSPNTGHAVLTPAAGHAVLAPKTGWLNCFIYPGRPVRVIDGLLTNFHLPESTLLMLVAALTGRERVLEAYRRAVAEKLRFFSYGDAMLIK